MFSFPFQGVVLSNFERTLLYGVKTGLAEESSKFPPYLKKLAEGQRELLVKKYLQCRSVSRRLDFNSFRWAWFTVNSRGVYIPDGSDNLALVPYLDMFNHSPEVRVKERLQF